MRHGVEKAPAECKPPRGPRLECSRRNGQQFQLEIRMVQLPATAAIEYVAACCRTKTWTKTETKTETKTRTKIRSRTKTRTKTKTGTKTKIGMITITVRGAYAHSPQVQCVYAPSRLSVPSIVAWRTNKQTNRQTRPPSSAGSRPMLPKFSEYVEVEAHYIFHASTIWVRPLFTELGPKNPHFCHKGNEYMSP